MNCPIPILGKGAGWLAVDKPAGISVHNDPDRDLISRLRQEQKIRDLLQPVHRLDKETSGVLLLATGAETLAQLAKIFRSRHIRKRYLALVHGEFQETAGSWTYPLTKAAAGRAQPAGRGKKLPARTRYSVKDQSPHYTLLDIELGTGRTHQIRRHAKLSGHPVVGDPRYGSPRALAFVREQKGFVRMGLHSAGLTLTLPGRGGGPVEQTLASPELPREMGELLAQDLP